MSFSLQCYIPSLQEIVSLTELSFKEFRNINKYIAQRDDILLEKAIKQIVDQSLSQKNLPLTNYDQFIVMFYLRCLNVSSDLEYTLNKKNVKINLLPFLNQCINTDLVFNKEIPVENLIIRLSTPARFIFDNDLDAAYNLIHSVSYENIVLNLVEEGISVMEYIPAIIQTEIQAYYKQLEEVFKSLVLTLPEMEEKIELNPFNSSLLQFIKLIYRTDLTSIYSMQYALVSKLHYSAEYVDNLTFKENRMILDIFEREQKQLEAERNQANTQKTGIPILPP